MSQTHKTSLSTRRLFAGVLLVTLVISIVWTGAEKTKAASAWNPTLLVNTESFQTIDSGDGTTNIELRFGENTNRRLFYDVSNNRFMFTMGLFVGGNLTATGSLSVKRGMSGATLRVDGNADIWGALSATGAIKSKSDITINSDNDTNDASLTFGNNTAAQTLKFMNGMQRFEFSKPLWVNGDLSASGSLFVQNNINTRADIKLNGDSAATDATITFGNASGDQTAKFSNANQRFEFSKGIKANGNLSGKTLTIDDTVTLNGVAYEFTGTQGGNNTFLRNDGAGNLTWASTSVGHGSGNVVSLHPEFPGAVYFASGSSVVGTMTYASSGALDNYYRWATTKATLQDYWVAVRVQVPRNFDSWDATAPIELRLRTTSTSAASNHITLRMIDTAGANVTLGTNAALTSSVVNTWRTVTVTRTGGTYTAGGYITILVKMAATTNNNADLGFINLNWSTTTP